MSELQVNNISPVGSGIKITAPVGIKTAPPTTAGDSLYVSGNTDIEGSVEVVTVQAQNYGVRIKSPANNGTSILQFTNNSGTTERAAIYADSANALNFSTAGNLRASINSTGLLNVNGQSVFGGNATFNSPLVTINQLLDIKGQATFADTAIPKCGGVPTIGSHLVNLDYLNSAASKVYCVGANETNTTETRTIVVAKGTYSIATFVGFDLPYDVGGEWTAYLNISISGSGVISTVVPHSTFWKKTGGGGHGRTFAGSQMGFATITVPNQTTLTITGQKSATAYNDSTYNSWVALLIKV